MPPTRSPASQRYRQLHDPEDDVEFDEGADVKATMQNVLSACKKVEDDCEIFGI